MLMQSMFNVAVDKIPGLDRPEKWSDAFKAFLNQCLQREPEKRATAEALLQVYTSKCEYALSVPWTDQRQDPFLKMSAKQQDMKQVLRQIFMGNQLKENGFF
jgi:serine/threonine protein kinase